MEKVEAIARTHSVFCNALSIFARPPLPHSSALAVNNYSQLVSPAPADYTALMAADFGSGGRYEKIPDRVKDEIKRYPLRDLP